MRDSIKPRTVWDSDLENSLAKSVGLEGRDESARATIAVLDIFRYPYSTTLRTMTEDRFIAIEIKLSRQEDLVEILNEQLYRQQKKIDELASLCAALARQLQHSARSSQDAPAAHEPPPHY